MMSWFCWILLVVLFRNTWVNLASSPNYTIHRDQVSFNHAAANCSPGVLTTLATELEVTDILRLISQSMSADQNEFTFWVGLRRLKNQCVVSTLPLRGFKWIEDGSEYSHGSPWTKEPKPTCTTVRCAALMGERNGSAVTRWGLVPFTCKNSYQFICKVRDRGTGIKPRPATQKPEPAKPEPRPATQKPEPAKPEPRPATQTPEPAKPEPRPATEKLGPKPETDLKPENGSELQRPDPNPGSDSCQRPLILSARSISFDNISRIQVECWSTDQMELRCSGRPAIWRLLDDSPANFTTVCLPCENGFRKDVSGKCVDVDECGGSSSPPCRHTCLNTEGSYRCFCSDENGKHHNEDSPACADMTTSGILIPVLAAVAALAVLLVVVAVMVKCCLMRQSKKQARKEADKMAMKSNDGRDSFETANEKAS